MLTIQIKKQLGTLAIETDIHLPEQGITALFGRSGSGKTSLINLIAGLLTPDGGSITIGNNRVFDSKQKINRPPEQRHIGYVFQDARLFPHLKVITNLNYGNKEKDPDQFKIITRLLGIEPLLQRYPASLSGGEKQRVAIGRALLSNPSMLLMDEPLASLDTPRKAELMPYLEQLTTEVNIPILYVSHSLDEILRLADQLILIDQGKIIANGPLAEVWSSPQMTPWQAEQDASVVLEAKLSHQHPDYAMTALALDNNLSLWTTRIDATEKTPVRLRIYAKDVSLVKQPSEQSSIRNILSMTVDSIEYSDSGDTCLVNLQAGRIQIKSSITRWAADELGLAKGQTIFAQIKGMSVTPKDRVPGL
ncbi:molybdenum ABC transporter ATP-binding protein ModC [Amphritea balenae]|uniref:Molybdenum ABC transporter ATP-binding protein ModC n=1 Tax=Amphritea balenae TaxID=452629 RepID=A0A3P1SYH8_9GAMM|nr:molybdenum ABC transporter ATP-binding protein ModC [Amphritea balenae]RRD01173.1 molybdenum ABC transporter ATP-binding protein ModC [Amphritea balenae]GGK59329.1 molybdenum import ATP-binding protein ModC [Amphritea balenae]